MGNIMKGMFNSTLKRFLAVAMAGSLVVTSGMFAYAFTSDTTSIATTSGQQDFATISGTNGVSAYNVFGNYRGKIGIGTLFELTPTTGYDGDLQVNVYLANPDELGKNYGLWMLRLRLVDGSDNHQNLGANTKVLTLNNGMVSFITDNLNAGTTYYIVVPVITNTGGRAMWPARMSSLRRVVKLSSILEALRRWCSVASAISRTVDCGAAMAVWIGRVLPGYAYGAMPSIVRQLHQWSWLFRETIERPRMRTYRNRETTATRNRNNGRNTNYHHPRRRPLQRHANARSARARTRSRG